LANHRLNELSESCARACSATADQMRRALSADVPATDATAIVLHKTFPQLWNHVPSGEGRGSGKTGERQDREGAGENFSGAARNIALCLPRPEGARGVLTHFLCVDPEVPDGSRPRCSAQRRPIYSVL